MTLPPEPAETPATPEPETALDERLANPQVERALLASLLFNPEMFHEVANIVQASDFAVLAHRYIWQAMQTLISETGTFDLPTLEHELQRRGVLDKIGGTAFLAELLTYEAHSLNAPYYARIVADLSLRRRLRDAASEIVRLAYQNDLSADEALAEAEKRLFAVSARRYEKDLVPLEQVLGELVEDLHERAARHDLSGIPTGFSKLDQILKGLQRSDLIIVAGRPGMGKTAFLISLARYAALQKRRVALFSLEMSNEQVAQRLLSQETGISASRFREPQRLTQEEWALLYEAVERLSALPIYLDDTPVLTPTQLRVKCRRLQHLYGLDIIFVDYLQLMHSGRRSESRVQEVSYISRMLKQLARDLNIPVVAAAQLSRAVEHRQDKKPVLADLRESGALEQDADVVMFLYRPSMYAREDDAKPSPDEPDVTKVIIAKHRNGPVGEVDLLFIPAAARFQDAPERAEIVLDATPPQPPMPPPTAQPFYPDEDEIGNFLPDEDALP
ncbi:MAG: replicative DNA helicase [Chloroflexi bacterium]|nr:replicative DNA helicase [Chloroflexota bacterium]